MFVSTLADLKTKKPALLLKTTMWLSKHCTSWNGLIGKWGFFRDKHFTTEKMQLQIAADSYFVLQVIPEHAILGHVELLQGFFFFFNSSWTPVQARGSVGFVLMPLCCCRALILFCAVSQCSWVVTGAILNPKPRESFKPSWCGRAAEDQVQSWFQPTIKSNSKPVPWRTGASENILSAPNRVDRPHGHGQRRQDPVTGPQAETLRLFSGSDDILEGMIFALTSPSNALQGG